MDSPPLPVEGPPKWPNGDLTPDRRPLVTITLPEIPLDDLIGYIASQTDLRFKFVKGNVVFYPADTEEQRRANKATILKKLSSITLPKVEFQKADIFQVLDYLENKSGELAADHIRINFQGYVPDEDTTPPFTRKVTLALHDVTLNDVLKAIHAQTNLDYTVTSQGILFTEPGP